MRDEKELIAKIQEIKTTWQGIQELAPDVAPLMRDELTGRLISLYWSLGFSSRQAIDMASTALGGDPLDWSP